MAPAGLNAKPRPIFNGVVAAAAGDLGGKMSDANLSKWLRNYGGRFSVDFDDNVTHLMATEDQFNKKTGRVKEALKQKKKKVQIVHPDWFEMSMHNNKLQPIKDFLHAALRKAANAKKRRDEKEEKGLRLAERYVNTEKYHIYYDSAVFSYQVELTRQAGERMFLEIWESHASPPLYFFAIKYYKKPGAMPRYHRPSDDPGSLEREMKHFRDSFKIKTGVAWNLRMKKADAKGFVNVPKGEKHGFRYQIPTRGKPVGLVNGRKYSVVGKDGDKKTAASLGKAPKMHTRPASESANRSVEDRIMTDVSNFAYEDSEPKSDAPKCRPASFATMDEGRIPNHPAVPREGQAIGHPQKKPSLALKSVLPGSRTPQKAIGHRMVPSAPSKRDTGVGSKRSRDMFQGAPTGTAQKELAVRMDPINESKLRAAKNSPVATRGRSRVKITVKGRGTSRDEATGHRAAASGPSSRPPTAQDRDGSDSDAAMQDAFDEGTEGPGFFSSQQGKNYAVRARAKKAIVGEPAVGSLPGVNAQDEDDADDESPGHEPHVDKSGGAEDLREQEHLAAMAEHARAAAAAGEDSDSGHSTDSDGL